MKIRLTLQIIQDNYPIVDSDYEADITLESDWVKEFETFVQKQQEGFEVIRNLKNQFPGSTVSVSLKREI